MDFYKEDGEMKSFEEVEAEYEKSLTRLDKVLRWWRRYSLLTVVSVMMVVMLGGLTWVAVDSYQKSQRCEAAGGIWLQSQCIKSDVIHKINVDQ